MTYISLFEFRNETEAALFRSIDDRVMGGVSSSALVATSDKTAAFTGIVSLENHGGFASIRAPLRHSDLSMGNGILLRVLGDGKRYKLRLMNSSSLDSVVYESSFDSPCVDWKDVALPFSSFTPMWRGKSVVDAPKFDKSKMFALGLMIAERQAGEFKLLLDWIRVYE